MTLEEAIKIKDSLTELTPSVEDFSWGPSWELAQRRRKQALKIIQTEIKRMQNKNYQFDPHHTPTLYVLVGVPGSGKSTWVQNQNWTKDCAYISTDMHVENYAKQLDKTYSEVFKEYMPTAVNLMVDDVNAARSLNKDIIWDQTSTTKLSRAKKFRMLPNYKKVAIIFKTPEEEELNIRLNSRKGKHIPKKVMDQMIKGLELPTKEEGFDEIWFVN